MSASEQSTSPRLQAVENAIAKIEASSHIGFKMAMTFVVGGAAAIVAGPLFTPFCVIAGGIVGGVANTALNHKRPLQEVLLSTVVGFMTGMIAGTILPILPVAAAGAATGYGLAAGTVRIAERISTALGRTPDATAPEHTAPAAAMTAAADKSAKFSLRALSAIFNKPQAAPQDAAPATPVAKPQAPKR